MGKSKNFRGNLRTFGRLLMFVGLFGPDMASAAVKCQMRLGVGCNGPVVYEIQLCAVITFNQGQCYNLCRGVANLCNMTDFDGWVSAYDDKGRNGFKGPLAETAASDNYDQTGQLAATSGNTYTICARERTDPISSYSPPIPVGSQPRTCPRVSIPNATNCGYGTVFNNDPVNPRCVTDTSTCLGQGSATNFVATINAGNQLVAVQNEHFINHAAIDPNLQTSAATFGTALPGLISPITGSTGVGLSAAPIQSSNSRGRSIGTPNTASGLTSGFGSGSDSGSAATNDPKAGVGVALVEGMEYGKGGSGSGMGSAAGIGTGTSWFGAGGAAAVAGSAAEGLAFGKDGADRGLASDGRLKIEDPDNYFLLSDVDVSLFKRVTAQCRKKERSLVLAP